MAILVDMDGKETCDAFGICGGCTLLNVPYQVQLSDKDESIAALFEGLADPAAIKPIKGMERPFHYRNKVIAPFVPARKGFRGKGEKAASPTGSSRSAKKTKGKGAAGAKRAQGGILTGMYARGTHKVVNTQACVLENEIAKDVVRAIKAIMLKHGIEPYDEDAGTGFLRHAVVRVGHNSGEVMVVLVTNSDEFPYSKSFCRELVRRVPEVTTVVQSVNTRQTNVVLGERENVLYGPGFILDRLCGLSFRISAHSFYQVNSSQTEVLYETAMELAHLEGREVVLDAYCGTGTIGLVAASRGARSVVGVDNVPSSIRDARQNARHNGIENAHFVVADASDFMLELARGDASLAGQGMAVSGDAPFVLFMDPPRAGATSEFLEAVNILGPKRIVYVSCNPETQVRDLAHLLHVGYQVDAVQPVDMFPHTPHVECVSALSRF